MHCSTLVLYLFTTHYSRTIGNSLFQKVRLKLNFSIDGDVAVVKQNVIQQDDFLDSDTPIRSDWPAIHVSDCFIEGDRAKLHGSVKPLRTFLPPTVLFRNAADIDEDLAEPDLPMSQSASLTDNIEIVTTHKGLAVKRSRKDRKDVEYMTVDDYFYGKQDGTSDYTEDKAEYRFKCAVCQRMFTSNVKLMHHILEHVDETSPALLCFRDNYICEHCPDSFQSAYELRVHNDKHKNEDILISRGGDQFSAQSASQLLIQQRGNNNSGSIDDELSNDPSLQDSINRPLPANLAHVCKICGRECVSELALAHHLQYTHRHKEMPYVCRLCMFRSSVYEDLLEHFYKDHSGSNHLLCAYCLRIFTPSDARPAGWSPPQSSLSGGVSTVGLGAGVGQTQVYLQHLRMHQVRHHLRRCPCCKLNFTNKSDYQVHRRLDHRTAIPGQYLHQELNIQARSITSNQIRDQLTEHQGKSSQENNQDLDLSHDAHDYVVHDTQKDEGMELAALDSEELESHRGRRENTVRRVGVAMMNDLDEVVEDPAKVKTTDNTEAVSAAPVTSKRPGPKSQSIARPAPKPLSPGLRKMAPSVAMAYQQHMARNPKATCLNAPEAGRMKDLSTLTLHVGNVNVLACLECDKFLNDDDHRRYLPCSACRYSTCCAAAFNRHVQRYHLRESSKIPTECLQTGSPFTRPLRFSWMGQTQADDSKKENQNGDLEDTELPDISIDPHKFTCISCGMRNLDGNSLACHMVEECGTQTATCEPSEELLTYRETLDEEMKILKEKEAIAAEQAAANRQLEYERQHKQQQENETQYQLEQINKAHTELQPEGIIAMEEDPQQVVGGTEDAMATTTALAVQTLGVLQPGQSVELTNDQGEVFQQLVWPEGIQLEEGQLMVVIQGDDGQAQLAIVNQQNYDPVTQQVILPSEEEIQEETLVQQQLEQEQSAADCGQQMIVYETGDGQLVQIAEDEKENKPY